MRDAFIKTLSELAERDSSILLLTGDLGFGVLNEYRERFPNQFINAGVAEQNMTALACGLALDGYKTYTYSIGNFPTLRCLEHIRNDVCYHSANVTIVAVGGGFSYGQLGMSHFATEDLAILRALPNMTVVAPTDPWEAARFTELLYHRSGPAYLRLDKARSDQPEVAVDDFSIRQLRIGGDLVILGTGGLLGEAMQAAELLATDGIETAVYAVPVVKPMDLEGLANAVLPDRPLITLEEHNTGGLGGAIAEACLRQGILPKPFLPLGLNDTYPTIVGDQDFLRAEFGLTGPQIAATCRTTLSATR